MVMETVTQSGATFWAAFGGYTAVVAGATYWLTKVYNKPKTK